MASVSGIRIPGLATGMDTETMVNQMLTNEKNKVDKAKQKQQKIEWQQQIYREVIKDVNELNDKYLSVTSKDSIISNSAWNTLKVNSGNTGVVKATGSAGASKVDYTFDVKRLATSAKISYKITDKNKKLSELDPSFTGKSFKLDLGDGVKSKTITLDKDDTVDSMMKKINDSMSGEIKATYSEMTQELKIETKKTGENATIGIIDVTINADKTETEGTSVVPSKNYTKGQNTDVDVKGADGTVLQTLKKESNIFSIDGIQYELNSIGTSHITSEEDTKAVADRMKKFIEDYNKIMDKVYNLVTEKTKKDYQPLTDEQKEDMDDKEIEKWEENAKKGVLRNDSELRRFMGDMERALFGDKMQDLNEMGFKRHEDYNKQGQITLDEEKFTKALQNNGDKVYEIFAKGSDSAFEGIKGTIKNYVGGSSSVFAKKAGLEKTASVVKNFYSDQIQQQQKFIKELQRKMNDKEEALYKKFATLESSINKLNSQMNYFTQQA